LEIEDTLQQVKLTLSYPPLEDCDVICRNVRFRNNSDSAVVLEKIMSATLDLELPGGWEVITLDGA